MNTEPKNEQVEQVEQVEQEIELDVKRVKSLKTNLKGGLAVREKQQTSCSRPSFD